MPRRHFSGLYLAYLRRDQGGQWQAADVGRYRISSFLDIYIEHQAMFSARSTLDEGEAPGTPGTSWSREAPAHRPASCVTPDYDALFSGDPYGPPNVVGGADLDGRALVTKNSYRDAAHALQSGTGA